MSPRAPGPLGSYRLDCPSKDEQESSHEGDCTYPGDDDDLDDSNRCEDINVFEQVLSDRVEQEHEGLEDAREWAFHFESRKFGHVEDQPGRTQCGGLEGESADIKSELADAHICDCLSTISMNSNSYESIPWDQPPPLSSLSTEANNTETEKIDEASTEEICQTINQQDALVAAAVADVVPKVAEAIDGIVERIRAGGRLFYMGAGTSGRLGVLDAAELPPTFTADPKQFVALIAGGDSALRTSSEGAEDSRITGTSDLNALSPTPNDSLIGIAASGRTPYVLGALQHARLCGLLTIGVVCVRPSQVQTEGNCQVLIDPVTGPEVITGSTRMKAGTATKMVLNMISTGLHIKLGKTYGNLLPIYAFFSFTPITQMIDVKASNTKLMDRARRIIRKVASEYTLPPTYSSIMHNDEHLNAVIVRCNRNVKLALVVIISGWGVNLCEDALVRRNGVLKAVLEDVRYETIVRVFNR
ncbi:hypothetical protein PQX77_013506 [Marasmius sp. AFHP31]|nr:hypothetical protein PQX77_013506 [Marasmius sp. AFHP31]